MKYIVIDGKKYKVDPNDSTKALMGADGLPVPYVEEDVPPVPPAPANIDDLEELAKTSPAVARMLQEKREADAKLAEAERLAEEARQETLRKNGQFQQLAEEAEAKRKKAEKDRDEANAVLEKYKGTVNELRDEMLAQIAEDKKTLIPEGSARTQIDYIRKNAAFLGVTLVNKGTVVPPNEEKPPLDEEAKLKKEFDELYAKTELTPTEQRRLGELSTLLKQIRNRKS